MKKQKWSLSFTVETETTTEAELLFDMVSDIIEEGHKLTKSQLNSVD
jgi:hypothetical protein